MLIPPSPDDSGFHKLSLLYFSDGRCGDYIFLPVVSIRPFIAFAAHAYKYNKYHHLTFTFVRCTFASE